MVITISTPALDKEAKEVVTIDANAPVANRQNNVLYRNRKLRKRPFSDGDRH